MLRGSRSPTTPAASSRIHEGHLHRRHRRWTVAARRSSSCQTTWPAVRSSAPSPRCLRVPQKDGLHQGRARETSGRRRRRTRDHSARCRRRSPRTHDRVRVSYFRPRTTPGVDREVDPSRVRTCPAPPSRAPAPCSSAALLHGTGLCGAECNREPPRRLVVTRFPGEWNP